MRKLFLILFFPIYVSAQTPPPPGVSPFFALDMDNDGYAIFNFPICIESSWVPGFENSSGQSLSGYTITVKKGDDVVGPLHTNAVPIIEYGYQLEFEYNGGGPEYVPQAPWFTPLSFYGGIYLHALPHDGDYDGDGITNEDEDANGNENLYDDDLNGNGYPDFYDGELAVAKFTKSDFYIYPNPAKDFIYVGFPEGVDSGIRISICDLNGKQIISTNDYLSPINITSLSSGVYSVKIKTAGEVVVYKLLVK